MNNEISRKIQSLSDSDFQTLLLNHQDATLMKSYILLIRDAANKKMGTREYVEGIYGKVRAKDFPRYENRFYKLRKKLNDILNNSSADDSTATRLLTEEEKQKEYCRNLIADGKFGEAEIETNALKKICYERNIFELLPEVIDMQIQVKHSLNKFTNTEQLYDEYKKAITLYTHISDAKIIVKRIYETNVRIGIKATEPYFKQLDRLSRLHSNYPRFKLIYNFVAAYYKAGAGGDDNHIKGNVISRHIVAAKKILATHPKVPMVNYTLNYEYVKQYRLAELEAMTLFRNFRFKEAADQIYKLLLSVVDAKDYLKRMLSEVLIVNSIHIQIAAQNSERAIECVKIYLKFFRDNKYAERLPRAYCELANVVSTLNIKQTFVSNAKLLQNISLFERINSSSNKEKQNGPELLLKIKMFSLMGNYAAARKILKEKAVRKHLNDELIIAFTDEILSLQNANQIEATSIKELKNRLSKLKHNSKKAENILMFNWLEKQLEKLVGKIQI